MTNAGAYSTYDDLCNKVKSMYKEVAEASINSEEEGSVLYFVGSFGEADEVVLSLAKLKTLEYRVFRKMREKLRNFIEAYHNNPKHADPRFKLEQFISETQELC